MTNRLIASPRQQGPRLSIDAKVELWNSQLTRDDICWVVGKDGKQHLQHIPTEFDATMQRIKVGRISQQEIDRLPFRVRQIAWNRNYLTCDYGDPPRYWLAGQATQEPQQHERTGLEWFNE